MIEIRYVVSEDSHGKPGVQFVEGEVREKTVKIPRSSVFGHRALIDREMWARTAKLPETAIASYVRRKEEKLEHAHFAVKQAEIQLKRAQDFQKQDPNFKE